ncbi:MAG: serine hydrolase [Limnothrix sp. RL_2_0]|nr:serine hydrolase [Limnothrix sp. RL_2_0]
MVGKSRRFKRKKKSSQASPDSDLKVVSLASHRRPKPKPPSSGSAAPPRRKNKPPNIPNAPSRPPRRRTTKKVAAKRRPTARHNRRFRLNLPKPILYPLRFLIVGVGIGAFIGTVLAISNSRPYIKVTQDVSKRGEEMSMENTSPLPLKTPLTALREDVTQAIAAAEELDAALLFVDLDSGEYLDVAASRPIPAASTIKIPILVAFFEAIDQGKIQLDDSWTVTEEVIGGGSGNLQYKAKGSQFSALFTASEMSINSDNTATNMAIEQLGGQEALNLRFQQWGMKQTQINNLLPDLDGTNITTASDLAYLLARINQGDILSTRSRDRLMRIMGATENDRLLPQSLGAGAEIVHKTGDIGFIIGDAGIIDMPNGKRYVAAIFIERPYNDPKGRDLLHNIAKKFYQYLEQAQKPETPTELELPPDSEAFLKTALLSTASTHPDEKN